jgi:hypothetical protein
MKDKRQTDRRQKLCFFSQQCLLLCKKFSTYDMDFFEGACSCVSALPLLLATKNAIKQQQKPFNKKPTKNAVRV